MRSAAAALLLPLMGLLALEARGADTPTPTPVERVPPTELAPGVILRELVGRELPPGRQSDALSVTQLQIDAGRATRPVRYRSSEMVLLVQSGHGTLQIGSQTLPLREGDFLRIPAGTPYQLQAPADSALEVYAIGSPAWQRADEVRDR